MQAEDLVVDQGGQGKVVEEIGKELPDVRIAILAQALVVETIDLGDLARFVIATKDGYAGGVANLEGDKESDGLDRIVAAIDVVT